MSFRRPSHSPIFAFCGFVIFATISLTGLTLWDSHRDARSSADRTAQKMAQAVEQEIAQSLETFDVYLQGMLENLRDPELGRLNPRIQKMLLFNRATASTYLNGLYIVDETGMVQTNSNTLAPGSTSVAHKDYFLAHRDRPDVGLFISTTYRDRVDNNSWALSLSRRITRADGSFGGIVFASLSLDYFTNFMSGLNLGPHGSLALFHADGTVIMRQPFQLTDIGKSLKSADLFRYFPEAREGRFETTSQIDQIHRVFTFRQIGNFPIIVSLGAATSDIYAAWSIKAALMIGMVAIVCLITLMLTVVLAREFTKRRDAEEAVRQSERRFRLLSENSSDAVVLRNLAGEREYASSGFYKLIGYSPEEIAGRTFSEFIAPDCKDIPKASIEKVLAGSKHVVDSFRFCRGDGSWVWIETISSPFAEENGTITGVVSSLRDITQRKLAEEELESKAANLADIAMRDALTGLANRRGFDERLKEEWSRAERGGDPLSLLMIDVDLFKSFNDALGHVAGDEALRRVANCISTHMLRPGDFGARYGGEEFALILRNTGSRGAYHVAEVLRNAIEGLKIPHPKGLNGHVTISLGLATVPDLPGIDLVQFVKAADAALYEAKRLGRNRVERFERHTGASDNTQTSLAS